MIAAAAVALSTVATKPAPDVRLAQTGPLATPVVNPRLGAPPPGGHLGETLRRPGAAVPNGARNTVPGSRPGAESTDRVGTPPAAANTTGVTGAVPPPARAVPDAPTGAVPPPATGAVPPAGR